MELIMLSVTGTVVLLLVELKDLFDQNVPRGSGGERG